MKNDNKQKGNGVLGLIIIIGLFWGVSSLFADEKQNEYTEYTPSYNSDNSNYSSSYNSVPSYYDEDPEYPAGFSGSADMEACNNETGNCYDLEIDSDGENIERINFPNGGWRDVDYSDCDEGHCVVEDEDGTEWELEYQE